MCRAMPFSARALKENIFFGVDIVIKNIKRKNWNMVYRGLYSYRKEYASLLFSQKIFRIVSVCWAILQKFLKGKADAYK